MPEYSDDEQGPAVKYIVMYSTEDEQETVIKQPKKASRNVKKTNTKAGRKVPKSPEFIDSSEEEEEGPPKDDKGKKMSPLLGVKKDQRFFGLREKDGGDSFYGGAL